MADYTLMAGGGPGGDPVEKRISGKRVTAFQVRYTDRVHAVLLYYDGGNIQIGKADGQDSGVINLEADEKITVISGGCQDEVDWVEIYTSKGQHHGPYGNSKGGLPYKYEIPACVTLVGLAGRAKARVNRIGIIVEGEAYPS